MPTWTRFSPAESVAVRFNDGVFTSDGTTILGADDKSAIAVILEALQRRSRKGSLPHGPLEIVLTTCEEVGLAGAKNLDFSRIYGPRSAMPWTGRTPKAVIVQAPSANRFEIRVVGKDAHAGAHPEKGINAIHLAAKAMAGLTIGRIDQETTCNIGMDRRAGSPPTSSRRWFDLQGEARSHDEEKLERVTAGDPGGLRARRSSEHRAVAGQDGLPRLEAGVAAQLFHGRASPRTTRW
ncbi:MAG: M20/M25/M40 family metallo-hydrolase [Desulfobacterales bacterium]|nr:M20/M25/M40 family metallo-hydrolase [Desulfobacterales bacterium]